MKGYVSTRVTFRNSDVPTYPCISPAPTFLVEVVHRQFLRKIGGSSSDVQVHVGLLVSRFLRLRFNALVASFSGTDVLP